jgi:hypothetical protein
MCPSSAVSKAAHTSNSLSLGLWWGAPEKERLPHQHTAAFEECRVRHFTALFRAGITRNGMWTAAPRQCFLCDR